jgi:hypothetical protein
MVEIGSPLAEGVVTAEWDYPALVELWEESETPLRRQMPLAQAGPILASVYARALPLSEAGHLALAEPVAAPQLAAPSPEEGPLVEAVQSPAVAGGMDAAAATMAPEPELAAPAVDLSSAEEVEAAPAEPSGRKFRFPWQRNG